LLIDEKLETNRPFDPADPSQSLRIVNRSPHQSLNNVDNQNPIPSPISESSNTMLANIERAPTGKHSRSATAS
jgi:hypothetical protein